ncbi:MAG: hypothetical protein AAF789_06170 [Bacteroidota bacterium]
MQIGRFSLLVFTLCILLACGDGNVVVQEDPNQVLNEQIEQIEDYLAENGFNSAEIDTTSSGVRFVVLNEGETPKVAESDFVTLDFIGRLLTDTIFTTTIEEVADSIRNVEGIDALFTSAFPAGEIYEPVVTTYSRTGWTFPRGNPSDLLFSGFVSGLITGVGEGLNGVGKNARILVLIPSSLAFGGTGDVTSFIVPPNTPVLYEVFLREIESQQ